MQKQGYRESTIRNTISSLKPIAKRTNILDPEQAKEYVAKTTLSENRKDKLTQDLARFNQYKTIPFIKPHYTRIEKLPFIPTETEIDQLIAGCGKKTACFLQLLKETGMRPGEAWNIKWIDTDTERRTVNVTPEKNFRPRQLPISTRLMAMLNDQDKTQNYIFRNPEVNSLKSLEYFRRNYEQTRKTIAIKLQNQRINSISFKTLRHFKATIEYHRTKDILHVMRLLGHKNIKNTLVYTHLVNFQSDDYVCKATKTVEEAKSLIENGFEYVTNIENVQLFRKRK